MAAGIQQPTRLTCEWVGQPALSMRNEHAVAVWTYLRYTSLRYHRHQHSNRCVLCTYSGSSMINFAMGGRGGEGGGRTACPASRRLCSTLADSMLQNFQFSLSARGLSYNILLWLLLRTRPVCAKEVKRKCRTFLVHFHGTV